MVHSMPRKSKYPISLFLIALAFNVTAKDINAADCTIDSLRQSIARASAGDIVLIPSGTCDWGSDTLAADAGVALKGSGRDLTIIYRSKPSNTKMIAIDCANKAKASISGITFRGIADEETADMGLSLFNGCVDFQVFDNRFTGFGNSGVEVSNFNRLNSSYQRGVIYKNEFIDNYKYGLGYGVSVYGTSETLGPPPYGSENFVFIENNFFKGNRHAVASNHEALYVFRHNNVTDNRRQFSAVDAHGKTSEDLGGTKAVEIYNNIISQTEYYPGSIGIGIRGGEALIFNNELKNIAKPILLTMEDSGRCEQIERENSGRPTNVYIWGNAPNNVSNGCESSIIEGVIGEAGKDYFYAKKPDYQPFSYPHPLIDGGTRLDTGVGPASSPPESISDLQVSP